MYYRKYLTPEYGEVAPEVEIMQPQEIDLNNARAWRIQSDFESIAAMTAAVKKCNCYTKLMQAVTDDIVCDFGEGPIRVRVYRPSIQAEKLPVLIFYHGGGYMMNSIEVYEYVFRYLCVSGNVIVVAPDYHLAPEYKFPKGLEEAYQTVLWTKKGISRFGGDPESLFVCGDSSGGNFAAVVSFLTKERSGPDLKGQILIFPVTTNYEEEMTDSEKRYEHGYFLEFNGTQYPLMPYFNDISETKLPEASPLLKEDLSMVPPACFINAECDPLLDQGLMDAAKLEDQGVPVEYHIMRGMVHGFINWTYRESFRALDLTTEYMWNNHGVRSHG